MPSIQTAQKTGTFRTDTVNAPPVRVDRAARVVFGCSLMEVGDLNSGDSRPWTVSDATLQQALQMAGRGNNGLKARFTHPNMSSDGMGSYLGRWRNLRIDNGKLRADLHIADAAFSSPQGDLGTYVMEMAENEPDMFGVSLATELDMESLATFDIMKERNPDSSRRWEMSFTGIRAGDVVDEPAATRGGMFDLLTVDNRNLPAQATALLSTYFGDAEPDVVRSRIAGFLDRYFANKGTLPMPDETPTATEPTEQPSTTIETPPEPAKPVHLDPVAEPDGTPQPQVVHFGTEDLGIYMSTFGDAEGARMFRDKLPFAAAMAQQFAACKGQIQDLQAENASLRAKTAELAKAMLGEEKPVDIGGTGRKSLSEAFRAKPQTN
jgi:hypothetical protein